MRAVDAVMECLKAEGVDVVFGLPGGANLPTYDAFYDAGIRHVLVRHEAGGGHAAEGYAKATGKVGVALATSGPGATNLVTPIADAMMDSVPVVFITGQVRTELLGTDGFQEADTLGITIPIVKHSFMIQHPLEIPRVIHEAFHIARTGRPGPVVIDIPQDLSRAEIPYEPVLDISLPGYQPTIEGNQKQIRQAANALASARRPVIYAGGGVVNSGASAELVELATFGRFPVTCTLMGLGAFPGTHEQWLGMLGMHGTRTANYAMDEADLICAVGARFDDRITGKLAEFAPHAKFIHIDIDPAEISKNVPAHIPIVGDARNILRKLLEEYRALEPDPARLTEWWARIDGWRAEHPLRYDDSTDTEIKPQYLIRALYEATGGEAVIVSDVGQHQMWAAQYYHFTRPRQWINSGGLGTMGFGLPAGDGGQGRLARRRRLRDRRRRLDPDERAGARHLRAGGDRREGVHHEQRLSGHGAPVAGAVLGPPLQPRRHGRAPGLRQARRGLRGHGPALHRQDLAGGGHPCGDRHPRRRRRGRACDARGEHLPDDRARRRRARHGGVIEMGEPGTKTPLSLEELDAAVGLRTGRKHVLSILVENRPGVLTRIAGLFARRGFNIETLTVGPTDDEQFSRITLTVDGALHPIDQVTKQLHKLVNVLKIRDLEPAGTVTRELALFKVAAEAQARSEILEFTQIFRGRVVDTTKRSITVEVTGDNEKIDAYERVVRPYGLIEMMRTGEIAMSRGRSET